ncbi:MAG: hypothetical protein ACLS48_03120 [[Eubacterium] siraeum]
MKIVVVSDSHKEFHKLNSVGENNLTPTLLYIWVTANTNSTM